MKHLTRKVLSVILVALVLFIQPFSHLDDAWGQTPNIKFNIETVNVGDDTIQGHAYPGKTITLKVNDQMFEQSIDQEGHFQFELTDTIQQKDQLTLIQGQNEIDIEIHPKDTPRTIQKAEAPFNSEGLAPADGTEPEKQAQQESQLADKAKNDTTEEKDAQKADTDAKQIKDKEQRSASDTANDSKQTHQSSTSEKSKATENDKTDASNHNDTSTTENKHAPSHNQPTVKRHVRLARSLAAQKDENDVTFDDVPSVSSYNQQINVNSDGPFRFAVQGKIVAVNNSTEFENAIKNADVEVIILKADVTNVRSQTIVSNSAQKVIEANHHSITMNGSQFLTKNQSSLTNLVIRNATNLFSSNTTQKTGLLQMTTPTDVNIVNSHFNSGLKGNSGNVGASWVSTLHFYGQNSINYTGTSDYAAYFSYMYVHDGASLELNSAAGGFDYYSDRPAPDYTGIKVGNHSRLSMDVSGTDLYLSGALKPYSFSVGDDAQVDLIGNSGFYNDTNNVNISVDIGNRSQVNIETFKGPAFRMSNAPFSFNVGSNSSLQLQSNNSVISNTGYNNSETSFKFASNSNIMMKKKDSMSSSPLFDFNMPSRWDIADVKQLDLNNSNGRLFNTQNHAFNINNIQIKGWLNTNKTDTSDYQVKPVKNGQFTLSNSNTTSNDAIRQADSKFNDHFSSQNLRRLTLTPYIIDAPQIKEPVYDNANSITGTALANASISVVNERTKQTLKTQANGTGQFTFSQIPTDWLKYKDILTFNASNENGTSKNTQIEVKGNTLRLLKPKDIQFLQTPIQFKPNQIIKRQANPYQVQVQNTLGSRNWSLNVKADHPLSSPNGVLNNALFFASTPGQFQSIENQAVKIGDANSSSPDDNQIQTIKWDDNTGILMKMNPIDAAAGDYQTDLTWTLTDGP
ncbi:hypothetical protein NP71_00645 [Staphylococcus schleiferi]|nr:hypothetical protein NP71_00645 [Staphylococcus schleiferi]